MSAVLPTHGDHGHEHAHDDHHHAPHGWQRWLYATNHKDIGTMYLLFSFAMLMVGGLLAMGIRAELFEPGLQLINPVYRPGDGNCCPTGGYKATYVVWDENVGAFFLRDHYS